MEERTKQYNDGDIIFKEGDRSLVAYIIVQGQVELFKAGTSNPVSIATLLIFMFSLSYFPDNNLRDILKLPTLMCHFLSSSQEYELPLKVQDISFLFSVSSACLLCLEAQKQLKHFPKSKEKI